jgi:diguanylate cyclase (GGDEF)-like protein/PAS domain S-box-containing protein
MPQTQQRIRKRSRHSHLYVFVATLLAIIWGGVHLDLQRAQRDARSGHLSELTNLTLAFSKEIESSVQTIDVTLSDLREHWDGDTERFAATVQRWQAYLENELIFQVAVIDAEGLLVFSNLERQLTPLDLSDREHFRVHIDRGSDTLFVSKPVLGRVSKRWSIQFTRPIYDQSGRFAGVLVLSVSPEYFYRFYQSIQLPPDSAITLTNPDGVVLSRYPKTNESLGRSLTGGPIGDSLDAPSGTFQRVSQMDGMDRLYAWRRLERLSLVVFVGYAIDEVMAPYREYQSRAFLVGAGLSALLLAFAYTKYISLKQEEQSAKEVAENEERWRLALHAAGEGVWDWNAGTNRVTVSPGWTQILGYEPNKMGYELEEWTKRVHREDLPRVLGEIQSHFEGKTSTYCSEHRLRCRDGSWKWVLDRGMVIERNRDGAPLRMVGTNADITDRKEMEAMMERYASIDELTGLNNRRCFLLRLQSELAHVRRYPQGSASVLMADLDYFKRINDTYGHAVGDIALKQFADLLRNAVRETDVLGRLGGEEFAVLLPETGAESAEFFAQRLCVMLRSVPVQVGEQSIPMTASIGVTMISPTDDGPDKVLKRADEALYQAKEFGRDRFQTKLAPPAPHQYGNEPSPRI